MTQKEQRYCAEFALKVRLTLETIRDADTCSFLEKFPSSLNTSFFQDSIVLRFLFPLMRS